MRTCDSKKKQMERDSKRPVVEKNLFHGTRKNVIDAICTSNFDWRLCGTHGTMYGHGWRTINTCFLITSLSYRGHSTRTGSFMTNAQTRPWGLKTIRKTTIFLSINFGAQSGGKFPLYRTVRAHIGGQALRLQPHQPHGWSDPALNWPNGWACLKWAGMPIMGNGSSRV